MSKTTDARTPDREPETSSTTAPANDAPPTMSNAPDVIYRVGATSPVRTPASVRVVVLPDASPANDECEDGFDVDRALTRDPEFSARLDAQRDAWIAAIEQDAAIEIEDETGDAAERGATEREGHGHDGT